MAELSGERVRVTDSPAACRIGGAARAPRDRIRTNRRSCTYEPATYQAVAGRGFAGVPAHPVAMIAARTRSKPTQAATYPPGVYAAACLAVRLPDRRALSVRIVFAGYLAAILAGLTFFLVIALLHR